MYVYLSAFDCRALYKDHRCPALFREKKKKNLKSKPEITLFLASRLDETDFLCFNIQPQTTTQTLCNTHTHTLTRVTQVYTFGQIVLYNTTLHIKEISLIPIISSFFSIQINTLQRKKAASHSLGSQIQLDIQYSCENKASNDCHDLFLPLISCASVIKQHSHAKLVQISTCPGPLNTTPRPAV